MSEHLYHAPSDCPVCGSELIITRKGCLKCGTELAGEFASCPFCALDETDRGILQVFLASRGNLRAVEKHLGVSYPTARARFDAVVARLGLKPAADDAAGEPEPAPAHAAEPEPGAEQGEYGTAQEQILARVATGELSPEVAAQLIANL